MLIDFDKDAKIIQWEKIVFWTLGQLDNCVQMSEVRPLSHFTHKNLFKMDHKCKTWNYQNFKRNLWSPGLAREFLNTPPKARYIKEKTDKRPLQN